ncbi:MAG: YihY/virulence factor BrkB family protein [Muribaculaceae bacterium]|nr:YihY/virulence factor BrkB family protein [Muribaculaceae bacterium]
MSESLPQEPSTENPGAIKRLSARLMGWVEYVTAGVWRDQRNTLWVRLVKIVNLSARSFMRSDLQSIACGLTYRVMLAIVPALALLFAIARGFGFQNILTAQLFNYFPSQRRALETAMRFVDSYLEQASEGLFVGVGIVVLLWTLISLLGAVEDAFNLIWGVSRGRSLWRKITDYTAIFLILPILMICGSGLTVFMTATVRDVLPFMSPVVSVLLDVSSVVLIWLFFTGAYMLVPNTKVKFRNAFPAGVMAGIAYQVLQALFLSGQLYVSKYNAIYGGFAFLPLLLIWMQLVSLFLLAGAVVCYSAQNISFYSFTSEVQSISNDYRRRVAVGVMAVIVQRYQAGQPPLTANALAADYSIPQRLLDMLLHDLEEVGLVNRVVTGPDDRTPAYQPSRDLSELTVGQVIDLLANRGTTDFIPEFDKRFAQIIESVDHIEELVRTSDPVKLTDIHLNSVNQTNQ